MHPLIPYFEPFSIPISGNLGIHGFGILVALGFIFGAQMAQKKCIRDGLDPEMVNRVIGYLVISVFVGGHLGHVLFYEPGYYLDHPIEIFYIWDGLSSIGGLIMATVLCVWFFKKEARRTRKENRRRVKEGKEPLPVFGVWPYADSLMYGMTLGWFFGRMGCFSAHDHPGLVTQFWLGVHGICPDRPITVACHDLGLYEAMWAGTLCLVFIVLDKKPRFPGFFCGLILAAYGPARFSMDYLRSVDSRYFGLTPAQYAALFMGFCGLYILWSQRQGTPVRPVAKVGAPQVEAVEGA